MASPRARAHDPADLVPPRDVRTVDEAGRHEERRRQAVRTQRRVGELVVVAVAVVERQRDAAAVPLRERVGQLVAGHDLDVTGEKAQLDVELLLRRAPQRRVVDAAVGAADAVIGQHEDAAPHRQAREDGAETGALDRARERFGAAGRVRSLAL
jgi:hypothetical protein